MHGNEPSLERLREIREQLAVEDAKKLAAIDAQIRRLEAEHDAENETHPQS